MPTTMLKRNQWAAYADISGTNELIGEGFTNLTESKNAKEYSRQYVHEQTERTDVTGYATSLDYTCDAYSGDPVIEKIIEITDREKTGSDAQLDVISVNLWTESAGSCEAYKRTYAVIPNQKGSGNDALVYSGTLRAVGDIIPGTFATATKAFTPT